MSGLKPCPGGEGLGCTDCSCRSLLLLASQRPRPKDAAVGLDTEVHPLELRPSS